MKRYHLLTILLMLCLSQLAVAQREGNNNKNRGDKERKDDKKSDDRRDDKDRDKDDDDDDDDRYDDWDDYVRKNKNRYDWGRGPKPGIFAWRVWGDRVYTDDEALVGIRTSNPLYALDINGQVNAAEYLLNGEPLVLASPIWSADDGLVTLPAGQKVGIGLSDPAYDLDVAGTINATQLLINGDPISIASNSISSTNGYELIAGGTGLNFNYQNSLLFSINNQGDVHTSGSIDASAYLINGAPLRLPEYDASGNLTVDGLVDADGFTINGEPYSPQTDQLTSTDGYSLIAGDGLRLSGTSGALMTVDGTGNVDFAGSINTSQLLIDGLPLSMETNQMGNEAGLNLNIDASGLSYNNQSDNLLSIDNAGNLSTNGTINTAGILVNGSPLTLETERLISLDGYDLTVGGDGLDFNYQNNDLLDIDGLGNVSTSGTVDASGFLINGELLNPTPSEIASAEGWKVIAESSGVLISNNGNLVGNFDDEGGFTVPEGFVSAASLSLTEAPYHIGAAPIVEFNGIEQTVIGYSMGFHYGGNQLMSISEEGNLDVSGSINASEILIDGEALDVSSDQITSEAGYSVRVGEEGILFGNEEAILGEFSDEGDFILTEGWINAPALALKDDSYYITTSPNVVFDGVDESIDGYTMSFNYEADELFNVNRSGDMLINGTINASGFLVNGEPLNFSSDRIVPSNPEGLSVIAGDEAVVFSADGEEIAGIDIEGSFFTQGSINASAYLIDGEPFAMNSGQISSAEGYSVNTYNDAISFEYAGGELLTVDSAGNTQVTGFVNASGFLVNGEALSIDQHSISYQGQDTTYSVSSHAEGVVIGRAVAGSPEDKFLIVDKNGLVGIGTTTPDKALTVKGQIHAEEVKIDLNVPVPDYVFEGDYKLKPIEEIEAYIKENKHLPYMASAAEVEKEGLTVGENQMNLLRTVEEMMLYQIEMNKQLELLKKQNEGLLKKVKELEGKIEE